MRLFINNEGQREEETAGIIMEYIKALPPADTAG